MYYITKRNPQIFTVGIYDNYLYGFGKENKKLYIYAKSIFDAGNWEVIFKININVLKGQCCINGLHISAILNETKIWIAINEKSSTITTRFFSLDIFTKEFTIFKVIDEFPASKLSCCNCSTSNIQHMKKMNNGKLCFAFMKSRHELYFPKNVYFYNVIIDELQQICQFVFLGLTRIGSTIYSNFIVNNERDILYVKEKYFSGRIKAFSMNNYLGQKVVEAQKGDTWNDIMFFYDGEKLCCLKKSKLFHFDNNKKVAPYYIIDVCSVDFSYFEGKIIFKKLSTFNVDSGFPSFESSSIFVTSNFFVFQSSKRITTIPRRMLSLSEYAYISCLGIPEPQKIKPSTFRFLKKLFPHQTKVDDPWMSMNFIMKTLKLSKKFELISSFE